MHSVLVTQRWLRRTRLLVLPVLALCLQMAPDLARAQAESGEAANAELEELSSGVLVLTPAEARMILNEVLPEEAQPRYALLQRQYSAARTLEDRAKLIAVASELALMGRNTSSGEHWVLDYLNAEFIWGSSGKALGASETYVTDPKISLSTRASIAMRQTYFAAQGNDRGVLERYWARAEVLSSDAVHQGSAPARLAEERLQIRAELERWRGDSAAAVATLREAVRVGRISYREAKSKNTPDSAALNAYGWLDGSLGMLTYALVHQGRSPEAVELAQSQVALWRAGQMSDNLGSRWNYRLATALVATQQYSAGLAAARLSDAMLQRAGASSASHTRWLARQEIVRALIGLRQWKEADDSYREFLSGMPADALARTRASDWRLLSLLAAKNGRLDDALESVERIHRFRTRLYGSNHPQTQEAAGVRAVVRLLRGEVSRAMADYESLFAATLDNPAGWIDLDQRGMRGYVFGIAFDEFMRYVTERALRGEVLEAAVTDRAMQIVDRNSLSVTQRALIDSSARLMANSPELRALLEEEQLQRQTVARLFSTLNETLVMEDKLRRESQAEDFKALPEADRKAHAERLKVIRDQIKSQQSTVTSARNKLTAHRELTARQFPAYADLVTPTTPRTEQLRRLLRDDEALLIVQPRELATLAWLVPPKGEAKFFVSPLTRDELASRVADVRKLLDLSTAAGGVRDAPLAQLHSLYKALVAPVASGLQGVRTLIVASEGPLASLPFSTLVTEPPGGSAPPSWLVRQMSVTQLPSASALLALRRSPSRVSAAKALIGFGDPAFKLPGSAPGNGVAQYDAAWGFRYADVTPLPETRRELLALATALGADPGIDLILGAAATRQAVLTTPLADRRVVAFATHGLMPGELPGISKPSLAMAANADLLQSPLLELDDILSLRLNAQWVVLSACNTAAGERGNGAMSGLVRAFFFAGTRSVLATHWAVESESAAALSTATFMSQAKGATVRSESLRQAQLSMLNGSLGEGRWAHPYFWAPYALFGDPSQ